MNSAEPCRAHGVSYPPPATAQGRSEQIGTKSEHPGCKLLPAAEWSLQRIEAVEFSRRNVRGGMAVNRSDHGLSHGRDLRKISR